MRPLKNVSGKKEPGETTTDDGAAALVSLLDEEIEPSGSVWTVGADGKLRRNGIVMDPE